MSGYREMELQSLLSMREEITAIGAEA